MTDRRYPGRVQREAEAAARPEPAPAAAEPAAAAPRKARAAAAPRPRKPARKKEPVRLRARWGVFDGGMKQVAVFDYCQRGAADQKVADLNAKKGGVYFVQIVKEPMPAPAAAPAG